MSWRPCGRKSGAVRKPPHSGDRKGCVCERAKGAKELETAPQRGVPGAPKAAAWDLRRAEDAKHVLRLRLPPLQRQRRVTYQPGLKGQVMAFKTGKRAEGPKHIGDPTTTGHDGPGFQPCGILSWGPVSLAFSQGWYVTRRWRRIGLLCFRRGCPESGPGYPARPHRPRTPDRRGRRSHTRRREPVNTTSCFCIGPSPLLPL